MSENKKTRRLIYLSLLIAMSIIFVRFVSFQTPITRIDFGFLPLSLAGAMFGPFWGALTGGAADLIGMLINNKGMPYFFPWTINAVLNGWLYGIFLHAKPKTLRRVSLCVIIQTIFVNLLLGTLWSGLYYLIILQKSAVFKVIFIQRVITALITAPVHIIVIRFVCRILQLHTRELSQEGEKTNETQE